MPLPLGISALAFFGSAFIALGIAKEFGGVDLLPVSTGAIRNASIRATPLFSIFCFIIMVAMFSIPGNGFAKFGMGSGMGMARLPMAETFDHQYLF
jgi:hypothetical protein